MRPLNSARMLTLLALSLLVGSVIVVCAQVPDPQLADASPDGPMRERRLVQRLEQARRLIAPSDPDSKPDFAQGVRLLQSILDDRRNDDDEFGAEDVFLDDDRAGKRSKETDNALKQNVEPLIEKLPAPSRERPQPYDKPIPADKKPEAKVRELPVLRKSMKHEARQLLGSLPLAGRQAYELLVGKVAQVEFEAAIEKRNWRGVEAVSRRWFHTPAGYDATYSLAMRDLDAGEPLAAALRLSELLLWPQASQSREPFFSLQLAVAWRMAGQSERCQNVLIQLKKTLAEKSLADKTVQRRVGNNSLPLFDKDADSLAWLDRWAGTVLKSGQTTRELQNDWPMVSGNGARTAFAAAAIPSQQPLWIRPLLDNGPEQREPEPKEKEEGEDAAEGDAAEPKSALTAPSPTTLPGSWGRVRVEVRTAVEQRIQAEQPVLPTAQPIVVGDTLIVRTLSQLQAFRLADGEPLWHSALLDSQLGELMVRPRRGRTSRVSQPELDSWLQKRVWEDVASGTLSSDGELIYSLQERSGGLFSQPQMAWRPIAQPREYNKLIAIEAKTGRLRWELGGPRLSDVELEGAGTYFLGPPLPWRGQLFVMTDDGVDLRLVVLDPRDGQTLWTQTLSNSDPIWWGVTHDAGLSPTIAGDCLLCPTGTGSLIAVDPIRRELRWQTTYREPTMRAVRGRFEFHPTMLPFESRWSCSALLVSGNHVLFAPPDHGEMFCLNAEDGRVLWKQARGDGLFIQGVTESGNTLIVGSNDVRAIKLSDGTQAWPHPAPIAPVFGRGVLIAGVLHLPVSSHGGEVVSLETQSGRQLTKVAVSKSLGNLIAANGQLVSQSASHVVAFPPLSETQENLARAFAQNADDATALEQRGRLNLHLGRRQRGLEDLRRAISLRPTPEAKQSLAALLLEELRFDQADLESTIRELDTLVDDPKQRLIFARLRAQSLQLRGELMPAVRELLKVADSWEPDTELQNFGDKIMARQDRWLAARMSELRDQLSLADREAFDVELKTRLRAAVDAMGHLSLKRYVSLFGWHEPTAAMARRAFVDRLDKKHKHEIEANLLSLRRSGLPEHQAFATARMAQQWLAAGQVETSRSLLEDLSGRFADVRSLDNKTGRELADGWLAEFREKLKLAWPKEPVQSEKIDEDVAISRSHRIEWVGAVDPLREHWQLELDPMRVVVARDGAGRIVWKWKPPVDEYAMRHVIGYYACSRGRWLVLALGGEFFVADMLTTSGEESSPRLLWPGTLIDRRTDQPTSTQPQPQPSPIPGMPLSYGMVDNTGRRLGRVMIVGDDVLCVQSGTRLIATRIATGDVLWTHDGIPIGCELSGDDQAVIAINNDRREVLVLSTLDGRLLARRELRGMAKISTVGRHLVTWTSSETGHELRVTDTITNTDVLHEQFAIGSRPCVSLRETVAVMEPSGRFVMWSVPDARKLIDQTLPAIPNLRHFLVTQDRERWMLMTYTEEPPVPNKLRTRATELSFDHWKIHGPCFAFNRATNKLLWSTEIDWQAVNAAQPVDSPVLVLAATIFRPNAEGTAINDGLKYKVDVLDKRSGRVVNLADELLKQRFEFCEQRPDFDDNTVEVQADRTLHRLTFSDTPPPKKVEPPKQKKAAQD